jgi:hypothetical protein
MNSAGAGEEAAAQTSGTALAYDGSKTNLTLDHSRVRFALRHTRKLRTPPVLATFFPLSPPPLHSAIHPLD